MRPRGKGSWREPVTPEKCVRKSSRRGGNFGRGRAFQGGQPQKRRSCPFGQPQHFGRLICPVFGQAGNDVRRHQLDDKRNGSLGAVRQRHNSYTPDLKQARKTGGRRAPQPAIALKQIDAVISHQHAAPLDQAQGKIGFPGPAGAQDQDTGVFRRAEWLAGTSQRETARVYVCN
jgi:hypothetical protein